jgi:DNA-binding LacI/PurR family transcriptional regulator
MKEVAQHAGVSVATVSNVITGKQVVSEIMRNKVLFSIKELNYSINLVARGLKTQRTNTIGVILPDITSMFFLDVLKGILETTVNKHFKINIFSSNYDFNTEKSLVNYLLSNRVDGIILNSCVDRQFAAEWAHELSVVSDIYSPPVVSLEYLFNEIETEDNKKHSVSSVVIDCKYWSSQITQHLINIGRKRIFFIAGPVYLEHEYERLEGYKDILIKNKIKVQNELISQGNFQSASAYDIVCSALKNNIKFDAIQASNDQAAIGAIKALKEHNLLVPKDVAVCGFDNLFPSTLITPAITTISVPRYQMGVQAVQEVFRRLNDPSAKPVQYTLDAEMIIRASSSEEIQTAWDLDNW